MEPNKNTRINILWASNSSPFSYSSAMLWKFNSYFYSGMRNHYNEKIFIVCFPIKEIGIYRWWRFVNPYMLEEYAT